MKVRHGVAFVSVMAVVRLTAAGLTPLEHKILAAVDQRREAAIDLLARAVNIPSATENHEGVKRVASSTPSS